MLQEIYNQLKKKMDSSLDVFRKNLGGIRTGRASASILDGISVDYYGTPTPLKQVATISIPESRLIAVQPWDVSILKEIEKTILASDLGLTPNNDGKIIRLPIPSLTQERRKELVKIVKRVAEDAKIAVRNIRREGNEQLKKAEKAKNVTEDECRKGIDQIQKITDDCIKNVDEISGKKEKEVLEE
ncbi:MAG: ribosome recycling factor [Nitrospinota bacterium]|jgi:ribosome recycling factor|nr:ribosome recycling factor [Nitrospinota bacterium]MDP7580922.1 ribosome recycling factor [Nitrospinota bacterium]HJN02791.1 ribosome recycling factor [Nitrospinota bacterium]|tara:strand:- start:256 stop:813 length:558 start_codon:yes stop_codon:yes gene_type:complete